MFISDIEDHLPLDDIDVIYQAIYGLREVIESKTFGPDFFAILLDDFIAKSLPEQQKAHGLYILMRIAVEVTQAQAARQIYDFVRQQPDSEAMQQLWKSFALPEIQDFLNQELLAYVDAIPYPFNCIEFARLELAEEEALVDPITEFVMNAPVTLYGCNYDFMTLHDIAPDDAGMRVEAFKRKPFLLSDLKPAPELYKQIRDKIAAEIAARHKLTGAMCRAARLGDTTVIQAMLDKKPKAPLHMVQMAGSFACRAGHVECAKYLSDISYVEQEVIKSKAASNSLAAKIRLATSGNNQVDDNFSVHFERLSHQDIQDIANAARSFNPEAQFLYALLLVLGYAQITLNDDQSAWLIPMIDQDLKKAAIYMKYSALGGCSAGQYFYAKSLIRRHGWYGKEAEEAAMYLKILADQGNANARRLYESFVFHQSNTYKLILPMFVLSTGIAMAATAVLAVTSRPKISKLVNF